MRRDAWAPREESACCAIRERMPRGSVRNSHWLNTGPGCRDKLGVIMPTKKELPLYADSAHRPWEVQCGPAGGRDGVHGLHLARYGAGRLDLRDDAARPGVRGDSMPGRIADLGGAAEGVCGHDPQQHGGRESWSTGANIVDQDFFEALGFRHYIAGDEYKYGHGDGELRELMIDRIYDTFIDEEELRICDETTEKIINGMAPKAYSSREIIREFGAYLEREGRTPANGNNDSIVFAAYEKDVPIFCPAFSDCSAGFGFVGAPARAAGKAVVSIDSAKDFLRTDAVEDCESDDRLLMIGGGVPEELCAGHCGGGRGTGRGCADAQVRDPGDGGGFARWRSVGFPRLRRRVPGARWTRPTSRWCTPKPRWRCR